MKKGIFFELLLQFLGDRPWLIALIVIGLIIAAGIWFYLQIEENKASEQFQRGERGRSDSIWKD